MHGAAGAAVELCKIDTGVSFSGRSWRESLAHLGDGH